MKISIVFLTQIARLNLKNKKDIVNAQFAKDATQAS